MLNRVILLSVCICLFASYLVAQVDCRPLLKKAVSAFDNGNGNLGKAFELLQKVELCDHRNELLKQRQVLQNKIFSAIEKKRQDAIEARKTAAKALEETKKLNDRILRASDSLQFLYNTLKNANEDKVKLILAEVLRNQLDKRFDEAVDKLQTAKILQALPELVNEAYINLCKTILARIRQNIQMQQFQIAINNYYAVSKLNVLPDSIQFINQLIQHKLATNIKQDIENTTFLEATDKVKLLNRIGLKKEDISNYHFELAFCLAETGQLAESKMHLDTLAHLRNKSTNSFQKWENLTVGDSITQLRRMRASLDPKMEDVLQARYFPEFFVKIPEGTVSFQTEKSARQNDCKATFKSFYLANKEITFGEYDLFCAATHRPKPQNAPNGRGPKPVVNVSWFDAIAYCNWRSRQENREPYYIINKTQQDSTAAQLEQISLNTNANGYRLPTEAEWQFAAGNGAEQTRYSWGNEISKTQAVANVADETLKSNFPKWTIFNGYTDDIMYASEASRFPPNSFGLHDMSGNVWEWCWDSDLNNSCNEGQNMKKRDFQEKRALRGGSWGSYPEDCQIQSRYYQSPGFSNFSTGFRLAHN